ncbi:MAG: hypothetical protein QM730_19460 [Anaerolineales bacterium]
MKIKTIRSIIATAMLALSIVACNAPNPSVPNATQAPEANAGEPTATVAAATEVPTQVPPTEAEAASACDNPYLPVIAGATWNYKLTGPVSDTYTHTVLSVESDSFTEQDTFGVGVTRQGNWKCENGNLIALNPPSGSSGTVASDKVKVDFQTKDVSGTTLPATVNAGDTWSQTIDLEGTETINGTEIPASNNVTSDCKAIGVESVTVEAGTFDAMRVECQNVMKISIQMGASPIDTTITLTGVSWYAENIGLVKNTITGSGLDSTTELTSYNIPQ